MFAHPFAGDACRVGVSVGEGELRNKQARNMSNGKCYCAYCGQSFKSVSELTRAGLCARHPDGPVRGKHKLYEGTEKTASTCVHHPKGHHRGHHEPAL